MLNTYQSPLHSLTTKMYNLYSQLHRITADLDLFCNQLSWVFAIFGCGYLRETKTFTLHLTTKTTPIIPNLAPKLCKFQGKGPGTPIERGIFDASQIATHLVDDAIATPKDGWMDPTTTRVGPMGCFFLQGMLLIKNSGLSMIIQIAAKCLRNEAA